MVQGHNTKKRLNIYAKYGTNTWNTLLCNNTSSIVGANITWTKTNNYYYHNATYNIYIIDNAYTVYSADIAHLNGTTLEFINSQKDSYVAANAVTIDLTSNFIFGGPWSKWNNVVTHIKFKREIVPTSTYSWFNGFKKIVEPWEGTIMSHKLTNMGHMFRGANNLSMIPEIPGDVVDADCAYQWTNVYGSPACGPNVQEFDSTYANCKNLTGSPVCGDRVINMCWTYANCFNLTGAPVFGPNVVNAMCAYENCRNIRLSDDMPVIIFGEQMNDMYSTFRNCINLFSNVTYYSHIYINNPNLSDGSMYRCFSNTQNPTTNRFDIIVHVPVTGTTWEAATTAGTYGLSHIDWYESEIAWGNSRYGITVIMDMDY